MKRFVVILAILAWMLLAFMSVPGCGNDSGGGGSDSGGVVADDDDSVDDDDTDDDDDDTDDDDAADDDDLDDDDTVDDDDADDDDEPGKLTWLNFGRGFTSAYCTVCHQDPPRFDAGFSLLTYADFSSGNIPLKIEVWTVDRKDMPPAAPFPSEDELWLLQKYIDTGYPYN